MLAIAADLATADGVERVVSRTVETFGGLDILVNNVGLGRGSTIVDTSDAEWHEAIDQTLFPGHPGLAAGRPAHAAARRRRRSS